MKSMYWAAVASFSVAASANAGALDRSGQSITALFEEGRYFELSLGSVSPDTSGVAAASLGGFSSGEIGPSYLQFGAAYKADINDQWSYALIIDQPFGADVSYPVGTGYFAAGSRAVVDSYALTGLLRYKFNNNFSVHGGLRAQTISASATLPFVNNYEVNGESDIGFGYVAGVAYERPEIALRVSLTYSSEIEHNNDTTETSAALGGPNASVTTIETPQSLNLEFQTGIAQDTLLFGGVRWAEYSQFSIEPANFSVLSGGAPLLDYEDDIFTWTLGVGRRINDNWSVSASLGYEKDNGGFETNLGPRDGIQSLSLAAIYTQDDMKITTGIRYAKLGDAETAIPGVAPAGTFDDNDVIAIGMRVGWQF